MDVLLKWIYIGCFVLLTDVKTAKFGLTENNSISSDLSGIGQSSNILTRRKRYLTFPDGSSFQLVFCMQIAASIPIGDIFLFSDTVALAWTLPNDPTLLNVLKHTASTDQSAQKRGDVQKHIHYLDEKGQLLAKVPYKRRPIINPAFAKRSIDSQETTSLPKNIKIDKKIMHKNQTKREFLNAENMDESSIRYHRNSRIGLYEKLETLFTALGQNGRQCVLKKLCDAAQHRAQQETFLMEILRVVFTLPKGENFKNEAHHAYDEAHRPNVVCSSLYTDCDWTERQD